MKPNFALSLSFEGITLLKRVSEGWHLLGEVTLDSEDLASDLATLRVAGLAFSNEPLSTIIVLPNDQIKFLSIDTGRVSEAKRLELAIGALESSTPYKADQLSVAIRSDGDITQVAAVARETLDEAESFATEHAFEPVCFTAIPLEDAFGSAPNFGLTKIFAETTGHENIVHEDELIRIVAQGPLSPSVPLPELEETKPKAVVEIVELAAVKSIDPVEDIPTPSPPTVTPKQPSEKIKFTSVRENGETSNSEFRLKLGGASRTSLRANAPSIPIETGPTADRALRFDPAKAVAGLKANAGPKPDLESAGDLQAGLSKSPSSFFSRRSKRSPEAAALVDPHPKFEAAVDTKRKHKQLAAQEKQKMTIFGARTEQEVGGKPRYLGLIMTLVLLLFLAAVALWAELFVEDGVAGLFKREETERIVLLDPEAAVIPTLETKIEEKIAATIELTPPSATSMENVALDTELSDPANPAYITDSAEIEAMIDDARPTALSEKEAEARYAVSGIWERAPRSLFSPGTETTEDLYATSIDRTLITLDAVALPALRSFLTDQPLASRLNPVAPGTTFDLDARGLVVATASGALSPEGILVYLGRPPVLPTSLPVREAAAVRPLSQADETRIASVRPRFRPNDLAETSQRASLGGLTRNELAEIRPKPRPMTEKDAAESDGTPTELAILVSQRPRQRPSNIAQLAQKSKTSEGVAAVPASATVTPKIPTTASVARQATIQNAINLKKVNLIGVYGTSSNRRALVRLASGRYKKVQVGDRIDGGKVAAISDQELRYVKSGKNIVLKMPKG